MQLSDNFKVYGNIGYTFRAPTFTDLYYSDPATSGNPNLQPETAFAQEIGFKYTADKFFGSIAFFNRDSDDLIDYIRPNTATNVFTATNIAEVNTKGFELEGTYNFSLANFNQMLNVSYTFLNDDILDQNKDLSRYSLNTLKHQFITKFTSKFFKNITQNIIYRYAERSNGQIYNVTFYNTNVSSFLKRFN